MPRPRSHPPLRSVPHASSALLGTALAALAALPGIAVAAPAERILDGFPVSGAQDYTAMTPVTIRDGEVFLATIDPGPNGDGPGRNDLRIRVRHGVPDGGGGWTWTQNVIEDRGIYDRWHMPPSVGIDDAGHVHVAYNMHNFPWQYQVSRRPMDIGAFDFRGQAMTQAELDRHTYQNKTSFPDLGTAAIPGNQVTYPAFENDRSGRLYVSYRFAAKPNRAFDERTFSTGLARYDSGSRTWSSLGGLLDHGPGDHTGSNAPETTLRAIASRTGWTSYLPRLSFDAAGAVTVSALWREGIAGAQMTRPCTVTTSDGESLAALDGTAVAAPVGPDDCPNVTSAAPNASYYSIGDAASDEAGNPYLLLSPVGRQREIHRWTGSAWVVENAPGNAVEILFDDDWNLWAVAEGLSLYLKRRGSSSWETIVRASSKNECLPHAGQDPADASVAVVFSIGCGADRGAVTRYDLRELRGDAGAPDATLAPASASSTTPPLTLARGAWQQVSVPFTSANMTPAGVFGAALPANGYGSTWAMYGYDAAAGAYFAPAAGDALETGRGYWMIQTVAPEVVVDAPTDAAPVTGVRDPACVGAACTRIGLETRAGARSTATGWNLGGVPASRAVRVSELRVRRAGSDCAGGCPLGRAGAAGLVGPELFRYDAATRAYDRLGEGGTLEPWDGYWAEALREAGAPTPELLFPSDPPRANLVARPAPVPVPDEPPSGPTRGPTSDDPGIDGA